MICSLDILSHRCEGNSKESFKPCMTFHKVSVSLKQENRVAAPFRFLFKPRTSDESRAVKKNYAQHSTEEKLDIFLLRFTICKSHRCPSKL